MKEISRKIKHSDGCDCLACYIEKCLEKKYRKKNSRFMIAYLDHNEKTFVVGSNMVDLERIAVIQTLYENTDLSQLENKCGQDEAN
jgi:hypothetical protein